MSPDELMARIIYALKHGGSVLINVETEDGHITVGEPYVMVGCCLERTAMRAKGVKPDEIRWMEASKELEAIMKRVEKGDKQ